MNKRRLSVTLFYCDPEDVLVPAKTNLKRTRENYSFISITLYACNGHICHFHKYPWVISILTRCQRSTWLHYINYIELFYFLLLSKLNFTYSYRKHERLLFCMFPLSHLTNQNQPPAGSIGCLQHNLSFSDCHGNLVHCCVDISYPVKTH